MQFQKISILSPMEGIGISWGLGGSGRSKNMKKCMKLYWDFQRGGDVLEKIPSVGEVWIFSGTTQYDTCFELRGVHIFFNKMLILAYINKTET